MTMTNEEIQAVLAANTQAINALVTQFIQPNAQQALENQRSIAQIIDLIDRHARAIAEIDLKLDRVADLQEANSQQIAAAIEQNAALGDRLEQYDQRLEGTRQLVAKNASDIAQLDTRYTQMFERLESNLKQIITNQDSNDRQITALDGQIEALAELSRTQLAGIIGNGRRIDRLEQQAS